MAFLRKNIKTYISSDDYHLSDTDKTIMLQKLVEIKIDFDERYHDKVYGDLYLIDILCKSNQLPIAKKILKYGISHEHFKFNMDQDEEQMINFIEKYSANTFYDLCLTFACKNNFRKMESLIIQSGAKFCSRCFNVRHQTIN